MDCTKTAGQILESSERQCRICSVSLLRFWHIALIVILITLPEKEFWAHLDSKENYKFDLRVKELI